MANEEGSTPTPKPRPRSGEDGTAPPDDFLDALELIIRVAGRVAHRQLHNREEASDVARDVATTVFFDWAAFARGDKELIPFVAGRAHQRAVDRLRQRRRRPAMDFDTRPPDRGFEFETAVGLRAEINDGLASLTRRQREAILRHFLDGQSYTEIGDQFGMTASGVRSMVATARARLKVYLGISD